MPVEPPEHGIEVHLDEVLAARGMSLTELSQLTGTTLANLSILKNGRARAVRFTSLTAICRASRCEPGDILKLAPAPTMGPARPQAGDPRGGRGGARGGGSSRR